jgi:hypothetical protein
MGIKKMMRIICAIFLLFSFPALANVIDSSANKPTFPPAGLTLLKTVTASSVRQNITVQNQSTDIVEVWRDQDCAGTQLSEIVLAAATATGGMGGAWSSSTFKNCIRVYAPSSGDQVMIYQN